MAHNLTESASFDANVSVPDGGDARVAASVEPAFQSLANRTTYLKALLDPMLMYARYRVQALSPGVDWPSKLTLSALSIPIDSGHFTLASNEVTVPAAGIYLVSATLRMGSYVATFPLELEAAITANTVGDAGECNQVRLGAIRAASSGVGWASGTGILKITDPASEKISIISHTDELHVTTDQPEACRSLTIVRLT